MSNTIAPDFETVFTPEYWEPVPIRLSPNSFSDIIRFCTQRATSETYEMAREKLLIAGSQLTEGKATNAIKDGELVGGPDDTKYGLPGAVLLIDDEWAVLNPKSEPPEFNYDGRIKSASEFSYSALTAFLSTHQPRPGKYPTNLTIYQQYKGRYIGDKGIYTRTVNLYTYFMTKKGDTAVLGLEEWRNGPGEPSVFAPGGFTRRAPGILEGRVGETINRTSRSEIPSYARIREARICIRGIAERSKARAPAKRFALSLGRAHTVA
jgi:hypothetical protein